MSDCFMCGRLTESAAKAEKRASDAEESAVAMADERTKTKKAVRDGLRLVAREVLRAIHGTPPLVLPHIAPRPRPAADIPDRFSLLELE